MDSVNSFQTEPISDSNIQSIFESEIGIYTNSERFFII